MVQQAALLRYVVHTEIDVGRIATVHGQLTMAVRLSFLAAREVEKPEPDGLSGLVHAITRKEEHRYVCLQSAYMTSGEPEPDGHERTSANIARGGTIDSIMRQVLPRIIGLSSTARSAREGSCDLPAR